MIPLVAASPSGRSRWLAHQRGPFELFKLLVLLLASFASSATARETATIYGTNVDGVTQELAVDRTPALYTGNFGDCLGGQSLFNITKFDAAYYADNMTVLFHLDGTTSVRNESLMVVITMEAYGESRYTQTFDPCYVNMHNLCPLNASLPLLGYASFSLTTQQTKDIPSIALTIPDFDGYVSLQIFANSTHAEIGCFQAVMTNGNTLRLPAIVGSTVGAFVVIAIGSSFLTAAYGISIPLMRAHYAHSVSVLIIMEVLQSIFLTGALSLHWPSVLVAWWSNFAWSVGLINPASLVSRAGAFAGVTGNASQVGSAGSTYVNSGGGQLAGQIYGRDLGRSFSHELGATLARRKYYNESDPYDYAWGGDPVIPGLPLPGSWQSFGGTLSEINIPGASAFTLSLVWMCAAMVAFPLLILLVKGLLELFVKLRWVRQDCLIYFRLHYQRYAVQTALRTFLAAFSPLITLAVFQFTLHSSTSTTALSAVVFLLLVLIMGLICAHAIRERLRAGHSEAPRGDGPSMYFPMFQRKHAKGKQTATVELQVQQPQQGDEESRGQRQLAATTENTTKLTGIHQDDNYIKRFGWLVSHYRAGAWWFFVVYFFFQLVRGCVLGGGGADNNSSSTSTGSRTSDAPPTAQVVVLFLLDLAILALYGYLKPFEGRRNLTLGVWILCSARALITALCIGLLPQININRIGATVIGFVIMIIQILELMVVVAFIVMGAFSTWLSLTRNQDDFNSETFFNTRKRYLTGLLASATGAPPPQKQSRREKRQQRKADRHAEREEERRVASMPSTFSVIDVRRAPKIEDLHFGGSESEGEGIPAQDRTAQRGHRRGTNSRAGGSMGSLGSRASLGQHGISSASGSGSAPTNIPTSSTAGPSSSSRAKPEASVTETAGAAAPRGGEEHNVLDSTVKKADTDEVDDEQDTLGDLGEVDVTIQSTKRRRANSGNFSSGSGGISISPQIYDPSRVIAKHNRSRTNSISSLRSVNSAAGSLHRVSAMSLTESPSTLTAPWKESHTLQRQSSFPLFMDTDVPPSSAGRMTPTIVGAIPDRMTPTKETLRRHASERRKSLPPPPPLDFD